MSNFAEGLCIATNISLFDQINKFETIKSAKEKLAEFQTTWREKHRNGGITSSTFDVLHALLLCVAPTMDDIRKKQPEVFAESCRTGKFFAFIYLDTIATKINSLQDSLLASMRLSKKTIYNQIKRLIEAGVISEKNNYNRTGNQNPQKDDKNKLGRGKIQLVFSTKILKFHNFSPPILPPNKQSLPQYSSSTILKNKELESKIDNAPPCGKVVSAIADESFLNVKNEGQGRKILEQNQKFEAKNKKDFSAWQLLNLCRSELFKMREMNNALEKQTLEIIKDLLASIEKEVQKYKSQKIKTFCDRETYKKSKLQVSMLKKYCEKLPNIERAAIEIFSHAVQKQSKHAKNNGYLHRIGNPPDFLLSPNFQKAINYSVQDWIKIQDNYFVKNQRFGAYCIELGTIGKIYTGVLDAAQDSIGFAYSQAITAYRNFKTRLSENQTLTESNKKALEDIFIGKFKPMFKVFKR